VRQEDWPHDHWMIDHSVDDAIGWMDEVYPIVKTV
jgi:hypothetical protein